MKIFSEHSDLQEYKKTVNVLARRKQARRMRMLSRQKAFQMKKKRTLMRMRDMAKITKSARKQIIKKFRKKLYPKYDSMAVSAKVKADQIVMQRFGKRIDKFTKRAAMRLRRQEPDRVKKFRKSVMDKSAPINKTQKPSPKQMLVTKKKSPSEARKNIARMHLRGIGQADVSKEGDQ